MIYLITGGTGILGSSLVSVPRKWEAVSTLIYLNRLIKKCSLFVGKTASFYDMGM